MVASLFDLKYWKERDVEKWFYKKLGARLDDIIHDGRIDGAKLLELDDRPKKLDRLLDKLSRKDYRRKDIKKFERSFELLMDDYHNKNDSRKRGGRRGRRSRKKSKNVWEELDYRDKDYIRVDDLSAYIKDELPSVDSKDRKKLIDKLDRKKRGKIWSRDFFDIFQPNSRFEDAVFDVVDPSKTKKGGKQSSVSPNDLKKLDKHRFCTYMEFRCGDIFRQYASQLMSMGNTVANVYDFSTEDYKIIPSYHRRQFMEAIRKPDLQLLGYIINKKGGAKKGMKKCPKKPQDVWEMMDKHESGRVYMRQFWRFIKKHCSWVKERDCIRVFDYLDQREKDYVSWKVFMKCFRGREFEEELEDVIYELGGRSRMRSRMSGRDAWKKIDKLDRGKIRKRNFEDFCLDVNLSRKDAKEAWRMMDDRGKGTVRKSIFHEFIPKKGDFVVSLKKLLKEGRHMKGDINFANLTMQQLQMWLEYVGPSYEVYGQIFQDQRITANDLVTLSDRELEMLIPNEQHRRTLLDKALNPDQEILRELFFTDSDWSKFYRMNAYSDNSEYGGRLSRNPRSFPYRDDGIGMAYHNSPRFFGSDYDLRRKRRLTPNIRMIY